MLPSKPLTLSSTNNVPKSSKVGRERELRPEDSLLLKEGKKGRVLEESQFDEKLARLDERGKDEMKKRVDVEKEKLQRR